jgi:plasmid maintenance system antidote protein VapI
MRYRFGPAFAHSLQIRGLDIQRVAEMADVCPGTVSSAVHGRHLNMRTAMRIAKVVAGSPVIAELEEWSGSRVVPPE